MSRLKTLVSQGPRTWGLLVPIAHLTAITVAREGEVGRMATPERRGPLLDNGGAVVCLFWWHPPSGEYEACNDTPTRKVMLPVLIWRTGKGMDYSGWGGVMRIKAGCPDGRGLMCVCE